MNDFERKWHSNEEGYFFNLNRRLIERKREDLSSRIESSVGKEHWMKCPKCDANLVEKELAGIKLDQCTGRTGIFFEARELEKLLETRDSNGCSTGMKKLLGVSRK